MCSVGAGSGKNKSVLSQVQMKYHISHAFSSVFFLPNTFLRGYHILHVFT